MKLKITPQETFFFKDARPFDKGEGWATGIFPPIPATFYGALRSASISQKSSITEFYGNDLISIREEMGNVQSPGTLHIGSQVITDQEGFYVPCPADLLEIPRSGRGRENLTSLIPNREDVISDMDLKLYRSSDKKFSKPEIPWISKYGLISYLLGRARVEGIEEPFWIPELKTGIQKDKKRGTAQEHMLYVQKMVRMKKDTAFSVDVKNCSTLDHTGILKLGHDGRVFQYERIDENNFDYLRPGTTEAVKQAIEKTGCFKLVFTTPAILKNGWLPGGVNKGNEYRWQVAPDLGVSIESVVIDRAMRIGGWKLNKSGSGTPKPMYKALAPGSVYYCRLETGTADTLLDVFFDKTYSDVDAGYAKQGFGHTLIAAINP